MAEVPEGITVVTETDKFYIPGRPCEQSNFSHVRTNRIGVPKERNCFNSDIKEHYPGSRYDRQFHKEEGYNNKLHRCDRAFAKSRGLTVNDEEVQKEVPTLSSTIYGHYLDMHTDHNDRQHVRVAHVKAEFYRRNGIPTKL